MHETVKKLINIHSKWKNQFSPTSASLSSTLLDMLGWISGRANPSENTDSRTRNHWNDYCTLSRFCRRRPLRARNRLPKLLLLLLFLFASSSLLPVVTFSHCFQFHIFLLLLPLTSYQAKPKQHWTVARDISEWVCCDLFRKKERKKSIRVKKKKKNSEETKWMIVNLSVSEGEWRLLWQEE